MPTGIYIRTEECNKAHKGWKHSKKSKEKMKLSNLGKHYSLKTEFKKGQIAPCLGRKLLNISGEKSHLWKGGITPINEKIRKSIEYKQWRKSVFQRDNYTCIWCNQQGGELNADHIKPFAFFPELRLILDNGRTLCIDCHKKTDTYGYKI